MPGRKQYALPPEQTIDAKLVQIQIGNLSAVATEAQIRAMFLPHGPVQFFDRPINQHTHRAGSLAYLEMAPAAAAVAIKALNGTRLGGEVLTVTAAALADWAPMASRVPHSSTPRRTVTPATPRQSSDAASGNRA